MSGKQTKELGSIAKEGLLLANEGSTGRRRFAESEWESILGFHA